MKKYLLPKSDEINSYKANLHCHTNLSDGHYTPEQVAKVYKDLGYSVLAYTDHDILIPHDELGDDDFLILHGFEMEINEPKDEPFYKIKTCHICFIALDEDNLIQPFWHRSKYLIHNAPKNAHLVKFDENEPDFEREYTPECISYIMQTARKKGFFVTYNHPTWSYESYPKYMNYNGMHAFEIFNGGASAEGYDDYNPRVYNDMLEKGQRLYCIGADDNHNKKPMGTRRFDSGLAFTVIRAKDLKYRTITKALEDGDFYASEGPEIKDIWVDEEGKAHITTAPADRIIITFEIRNSQVYYAENGQPIEYANFIIRPEYGWFRFTVVDERGRKACTNAFYPEDVL